MIQYTIPNTIFICKFMFGINKLCKKKNINKTILLITLQDYFNNVIAPKESFVTDKRIRSLLRDYINRDFSLFLTYLTKHSGVEFKKRKYSNNHIISSSWEESNLNGDFAYNNSTEDF